MGEVRGSERPWTLRCMTLSLKSKRAIQQSKTCSDASPAFHLFNLTRIRHPPLTNAELFEHLKALNKDHLELPTKLVGGKHAHASSPMRSPFLEHMCGLRHRYCAPQPHNESKSTRAASETETQLDSSGSQSNEREVVAYVRIVCEHYWTFDDTARVRYFQAPASSHTMGEVRVEPEMHCLRWLPTRVAPPPPILSHARPSAYPHVRSLLDGHPNDHPPHGTMRRPPHHYIGSRIWP